MKKIIEMSSLLVIMIAVTIIDLKIYEKKETNNKIDEYEVARKYELAQADIDSITVTTFDNFIMNQINKEKIRKNEEAYNEYQEYLKTLVVYDGMTMDELAQKLEKSLKNELSGYGYLYASYSLEHGVDPYMAVAISLHETGCNAKCSRLMVECNNVGGQKGSPSCGSFGYRQFETLEDGIKGYIDNLSENYFGIGLNTPELMEKKYAGGSDSWAGKVNNYISTIKSR